MRSGGFFMEAGILRAVVPFAPVLSWANLLPAGGPMGREDAAAGKAKQLKGKVNDVVGALKGDSSQQAKGKIQKGVGKVQEALGKGSARAGNARRAAR